MDLLGFFKLLGGLALFLFGMSLMGDALEKRAGSRLKGIMEKMTSNPIKGFLLGLGVTAIIQSSSATTVMVVGFVNSGIMTLRQAVGVVMGANLGTSVTSWLLSLTGIKGDSFWVTLLKPATFTPVLAFVGIIMYMFIKNTKKRDTGMIFLGFAVLMFGMEMMSDSVAGLSQVPEFRNVLTLFSNPVLGVAVGAVFTAIIQSSSASVGILQALTLTGSITYMTAIPIIMGQNIGTCISAIISSIGATKNAKRVSVVHLSFNVISTVVWLTVFYVVNSIFNLEFVNDIASPLGIAVVHTVFKILALCLLMPFTKQLEKLSCRIIKDSKDKEELQLLDDRLLNTPAVAIARCRDIAVNMATMSIETLNQSLDMLYNYNEKIDEKIRAGEDKIDMYEDSLGTYLVKVCSQPLTEQDSHEATKLLHIIGDIERISDHAVNILGSAEEIFDKKIKFSESAQREIDTAVNAIKEILAMSLKAFCDDDTEIAKHVEPLEQVIDGIIAASKKNHVSRLQQGKCTIELGFVLSDLFNNFERVSDHCSNIAVCVIEINNSSLDTHNYLRNLEDSQEPEYMNTFKEYQQKYSVAKI